MEAGLSKAMNKVTWIFSKKLAKYVRMNLFLEPVTLLKMNFFLGIFQGFCLIVPKDYFYKTPCRFV